MTIDALKKQQESKMVMDAYMDYYSKALELDNIYNPVAWALYHTWNDAADHPRKFK